MLGERAGRNLLLLGIGAALPLAAAPAGALQIGPGRIMDLVVLIALFAICGAVHEAAHAWTAWRCGDPTARDLGRMTLNPIPHIDLFMTILLPAMLFFGSGGTMLFGGAKPVPVNFHRLRSPWRDMSLVAIAGPASNVVLAFVFILLWGFFIKTGLYNQAAATPVDRIGDFLPLVLLQAVHFNVLLAVFNMLPIPPLDGSRVMAWILPEGLRPPYLAMERFGLLIIFGLLYLWPEFRRWLHVEVVSASVGRLIEAVFPWAAS